MVPTAAERILRLAAYLELHRKDDVTISDITRDLAGYDDGTAARDDADRLISETPEWEACRKMLQRDLKDLRESWGIVVEYNDATHCYRLATPFLSAPDRAALISAAAVVAVEGLQPRQAGAIGSAVDDGAARVVVQVHAYVAAFRDAIASRTPLQFRHEGRVRILQPWALGVWRNKWYVAGSDPAHDGAMRRFRLDRITPEPAGGELAWSGPGGAYEIPDWFDVDKAFDFDPNSWGSDPALDARIRVQPDHVNAFLHEFGGAIVERDDREVTIELTVRHYESFRNRLFGLRGHATVISPPELVASVRDHLAAVVGSAG